MELVSKNTSLYVQQCCSEKCFKLWCVLSAVQCMTQSVENLFVLYDVEFAVSKSNNSFCCSHHHAQMEPPSADGMLHRTFSDGLGHSQSCT